MMGIIWEEAEVTAQNRSEWHQSVAQCTNLKSYPDLAHAPTPPASAYRMGPLF